MKTANICISEIYGVKKASDGGRNIATTVAVERGSGSRVFLLQAWLSSEI